MSKVTGRTPNASGLPNTPFKVYSMLLSAAKMIKSFILKRLMREVFPMLPLPANPVA